jgi:hypothetical protein
LVDKERETILIFKKTAELIVMKFDEIIKSHKLWKLKISDYIISPDKSLRPENCNDRNCELAKWFSSEDSDKFRSYPEFQELMKAHKSFHHTLAEIVFNANKGVKIEEDMAIGIDSPFNRHYETFMKAMTKMKSVVETHRKNHSSEEENAA